GGGFVGSEGGGAGNRAGGAERERLVIIIELQLAASDAHGIEDGLMHLDDFLERLASRGYLSANRRKPTSSSMRCARALMSRLGKRRILSGNTTFFAAVMCGNRA